MKWKSLLTLIVAGCSMSSLALATDSYFDSNGVKIRYVTEGEGEPIVLVHGWMSDSSMWGSDSKGQTKLSGLPGFQIIALDCRGHGKSDKPHEVEKYGAEMAADVVRLLDYLKIKKAHLVGYSMGTFIVGKVAATHPERVLSLVYGGQAPLLTGESGSREIDAFAKAVDQGKGLGSYIIEISPAGRPKPTLEQANAYAEFLYGKKDVKAFAASGRSFGGLEVRSEDLAKCEAPRLFIYGDRDVKNTKDRVASLLRASGGELKVVAGADHMTTLVKPEFGNAVVEFVRAHKAGAQKSFR